MGPHIVASSFLLGILSRRGRSRYGRHSGGHHGFAARSFANSSPGFHAGMRRPFAIALAGDEEELRVLDRAGQVPARVELVGGLVVVHVLVRLDDLLALARRACRRTTARPARRSPGTPTFAKLNWSER